MATFCPGCNLGSEIMDDDLAPAYNRSLTCSKLTSAFQTSAVSTGWFHALLFFFLFQELKDTLSSRRHGLEHIGNLRELRESVA